MSAPDSVEMTIDELIRVSHAQARRSGRWVEGQHRSFGDLIALCHSELSGAFEGYRNGEEVNRIYYRKSEPCGIPIELADVLIRIADMCGAYRINLEEAINLRIQYNASRLE